MERRRYFRVEDTLKLSYQILKASGEAPVSNAFDLIAEQDRRMEVLIAENKTKFPELVELISLLNQKIERLTEIDKVANKSITYQARAVNLSACGIGFPETDAIGVGSLLRLFMLLDGKKLDIDGMVIACEKGVGGFMWRVDFLHPSESAQEQLIHYLVRKQRDLLKRQRGLAL
jgi:hypothetical protein